jgi:hypothetical protein
MKKLIISLSLFFICCAPVFTAQNSPFIITIKDYMAKNKAVSRNADLLSLRYAYMITDTPTNNYQAEPSIWDTVSSFFSGKDQKIKSLAAYLYNVYVSVGANGILSAQPSLNFDYIGVTDPLIHLLGTHKQGDLLKFYKENKAAIKDEIENLMKDRLGLLTYDPGETATDALEESFITVLLGSVAQKKHYGYAILRAQLRGNDDTRQIEESLLRDLKKVQTQSANENINKVVTYKYIDPMQALDNAGSFARKSSSSAQKITYRYVNEECFYCAYAFCREICSTLWSEYANWQIFKIYMINAYPKTAGKLPPAEGTHFMLKDGRQKQWDYHTATLLMLRKDGLIKSVVVDDFLLEGPSSLQNWAGRFNADETIFNIIPFTRNRQMESNITDKQNLPRSAEPHPVYN